ASSFLTWLWSAWRVMPSRAAGHDAPGAPLPRQEAGGARPRGEGGPGGRDAMPRARRRRSGAAAARRGRHTVRRERVRPRHPSRGRMRGGAAAIVLAVLMASLPAAALPGPSPGPFLPHAPILVEGDANFTAAHGVVSGSGAPSDPYVIAGWSI